MKLTSYENAAKYFKVSVLAICKAVQDNNVKKYKEGKYLYIDLDDLIEIDSGSKIRPLVEILEEIRLSRAEE